MSIRQQVDDLVDLYARAHADTGLTEEEQKLPEAEQKLVEAERKIAALEAKNQILEDDKELLKRAHVDEKERLEKEHADEKEKLQKELQDRRFAAGHRLGLERLKVKSLERRLGETRNLVANLRKALASKEK